MIKSTITDIKNGISAGIDENNESGNGLIVSSRPQFEYDFQHRNFINPTYGIEMNQNATFGGTPILVYDENVGSGSGEWNTSAISGTWTFNSATQHYNGSVSIDGSAAITNSVAQFAPGAGSFSFTGYVAITGWVYLTSWKAGSHIDIYGWNTTTGTIVGTAVNIANYINTGTLNVWQRFIIPISDMNLTDQTINTLHIQVIGTPPPDFFLDYIRIQETGGPIIYRLDPLYDETMHVCSLNFTFAGPYTGITTVAGATENATFTNLSYDKILGLTLTNGLIYIRIQNNKSVVSFNIKTLFDFLSLSNTDVVNFFGDGTNALLKLRLQFLYPVKLVGKTLDYISISVNDDLSSWLKFRSAACCNILI